MELKEAEGEEGVKVMTEKDGSQSGDARGEERGDLLMILRQRNRSFALLILEVNVGTDVD